MLVASDEATAGSVIPKHDRMSPERRGSSHSRCVCVCVRVRCRCRWVHKSFLIFF